MIRRTWMLAGTLAIAACAVTGTPEQAPTTAQELRDRPDAIRMPLVFEANQGQTHVSVDFLARADG